MDDMSFLVIALVFVLGLGYIVSIAPDNSSAGSLGNFSNGENVTAPPENSSTIDKVAAQTDNLVSPFVGLSTSNPILSIIIVIILAGLSYLLAKILKDLVPFT